VAFASLASSLEPAGLLPSASLVPGNRRGCVLNSRLITDEGPTATSTVTYLPVVAVALGIVVARASRSHLLVGTAIVLIDIVCCSARISSAEASTQHRRP
jgi:hypothetical protein